VHSLAPNISAFSRLADLELGNIERQVFFADLVEAADEARISAGDRTSARHHRRSEKCHYRKWGNYSITTSERASRVGGISMPSALAVLRLIVSSNLAGCSTGRFAGSAPFKILST
jgi:hypothetical protein